MARVAALLRGVNVGGHRKVPMAALREVVESLGHGDVATYLQSGNVVFRPGVRSGADGLGRSLSKALEERFGFPVVVVMRTASQLASLVDDNPFAAAASPTTVHVAFLADRVTTAVVQDAFGDGRFAPDVGQLARSRRDVYLHLPNGMGRAKLTGDAVERALRVAATARNWNTVRALAGLTAR